MSICTIACYSEYELFWDCQFFLFFLYLAQNAAYKICRTLNNFWKKSKIQMNSSEMKNARYVTEYRVFRKYDMWTLVAFIYIHSGDFLHVCLVNCFCLISEFSYTLQLHLTEQYDSKVISSKIVMNCFVIYLMEWEQKKSRWVLKS